MASAGDSEGLASVSSLLCDLGRFIEYVATYHSSTEEAQPSASAALPATPEPTPASSASMPASPAAHAMLYSAELMVEVGQALLQTAIACGWDHTANYIVSGLAELGVPQPSSQAAANPPSPLKPLLPALASAVSAHLPLQRQGAVDVSTSGRDLPPALRLPVLASAAVPEARLVSQAADMLTEESPMHSPGRMSSPKSQPAAFSRS